MSTNGSDKTIITCSSCQQRFSAPIPKLAIFNDLSTSIVAAPHEKPIRCLCGKSFVLGVHVAEIQWIVIPITDQQAASMAESKIIVPSLVIN